MKILFVVTRLNRPEKMNSFIFTQGESLRAAGCEIEYFFVDGPPVLKYVFSIFKLKKVLRFSNFDIIHAHYNLCGFVASFQKKNPLIISFLGSDILQKGFAKMLNYLLNKRILKHSAGIIVKTKQMSEKIKHYNLHVIPNGVNLELFKPIDKEEAKSKLQLDINKKYILFASDPKRKEKKFHLAQKSVSLLNDEKVILWPVFKIPHQLLYLYYNACEMLILTSTHEGSVNTVKEALACNCPIVTVKVGDVEENIYEVKNCILADRNPKIISEAIRNILNNNGRSDGRKKMNHLSTQAIAENIIHFYNTILEKKYK